MELAIPMVVLGGMYVLSNKDNNKTNQVKGYNDSSLVKEGFTNDNNREHPKRKQRFFQMCRTGNR